jgi:DNA-binding transcriptional MerR regulator
MHTSHEPGDAGFLTIRQACDEFALTQRALRFYEASALLAPKRERRRRLYQRRDVECLRTIVKLRSFAL